MSLLTFLIRLYWFVLYIAVVANGVATQAGVLQSDQRIGRRGRRQKTSNKVVGPSESTGKERESETLRSNGGRSLFSFLFFSLPHDFRE